MIEALDHVGAAVGDLGRAASAYGALFGRRADVLDEVAGARRARFQFANMALELMQPVGPGEVGERTRAWLAAHGEGLCELAFATSDLDRTRRAMARRGAPSAEPAQSAQGARLTFIDPAAAHGVSISLVERARPGQAPPAAADAVQALDHVVINTAHPDRAVALYGARLGLDFRLDRANPQWGSRLMFFRCGGAVVEIGSSLKAADANAPDRISGLAWRIADPDAARARIAAAGFDVSEVRTGRKPGTKVFTVRAGVPGAPALMLSAEPAAEEV